MSIAPIMNAYILQSDAIASDSEHIAINSTTICEGGISMYDYRNA